VKGEDFSLTSHSFLICLSYVILDLFSFTYLSVVMTWSDIDFCEYNLSIIALLLESGFDICPSERNRLSKPSSNTLA
jgi:hypothetical protein